MNAGKYLAVSAYTDTQVLHRGVVILTVPAGKQGFVVKPSVIPVRTVGSCHITECNDPAKAMVLQHAGTDEIHVEPELREELSQATSGIVDLRAEQAVQDAAIATNTANIATNTANIATNTANIATNTANIATNTSSISSLQSSQTAQNTSISSLQSSVTALQGAAKNFLPNWANAVPLALSDNFSYTAPCNGWLIGHDWHYSSNDTLIKINGVQVGYGDYDGAVYIQVLMSQGDVLTIPDGGNGAFNFVPCKA
ncbi:MAG: hypothetical protein R3Y56_02635 [Akkermansia sp.]